MVRTKVLLIFGGESSEHEVSISSAKNVLAALNKTKYDISICYIDQKGGWWLTSDVTDEIDTKKLRHLSPQLGLGQFAIQDSYDVLSPDVILPILHGLNGEDGTVQGLADLMHIPIAGCDLLSSAICMDKVIAKQLFEVNSIPTTPYFVHMDDDSNVGFAEFSSQLGESMFVKPARSGSSVGVSKVSGEEELSSALKLAHKYDKKVLIEKGITGRELEVAILGSGKKAKASVVGEICPDREFYSYESKYDSASSTKVVIPADVDPEVASEIRTLAVKAFQVVDGRGLARVDFFLSDDGSIYLNEINTMPGFTNISMYPKLWDSTGMPYDKLLDYLIDDALEN